LAGKEDGTTERRDVEVLVRVRMKGLVAQIEECRGRAKRRVASPFLASAVEEEEEEEEVGFACARPLVQYLLASVKLFRDGTTGWTKNTTWTHMPCAKGAHHHVPPSSPLTFRRSWQ